MPKKLIWLVLICGLTFAVACMQINKDEQQSTVKVLIINGRFLSDTLTHEPLRGTIRFTIETANGEKIKVIHQGPKISGLANGAELAVEGSFSVEGVFLAKRIWTSRGRM